MAAALVLAASAAAGPERKSRPSVALVKESPVVVSGRGFARLERVVLRVSVAGRAYRRTLRATAAGTFRATFESADADCKPFTVTAAGGTGSRAMQTRRFTVPPPCGIAPQP